MRILLISLLILSFFITACSNKNAIRDIDYDLEFEKGKTALAKKKFIFYEVPISYMGRSYEQGKKITIKDAFVAVYCIVKYRFFD